MIAAAVGFQCPACVRSGRQQLRRATRPQRLRRGLRAAAAVLAAACFVAALGWYGRTHLPAPLDPGAQSPQIDDPAAGAFDGTPAAGYAVGEAGLVLPSPAPVDGWSAAEVAETLDQTHRVLAAMVLDRRALVDHDPAVILALLAPASRDTVATFYRAPAESRAVPLISPKVRLADEQPRVSGTVTLRTATDDSCHPLEIVTNFVVVYPFATPSTGPGSRLVISRFADTWRRYRAADVGSEDRGLWFHSADGYAFNIDCAEFAAGLLAPPTAWSATDDDAVDDPDGFYDPARSLDLTSTCRLPSPSSHA